MSPDAAVPPPERLPPPEEVTATSEVDGLGVSWKPGPGSPADTSYEIALDPATSPRTASGTRLVFRDAARGGTYQASVVAVVGDRRSTAAKSDRQLLELRPRRRPTARAGSLVLGGLFLLAAAALFGVSFAANQLILLSLAMACAVLGVIVSVLTVMGGKPHGLVQLLIGVDGRVSTSYVQIALWTALVTFLLVYFTGLTWFAHRPDLFEAVALQTAPDGPPGSPPIAATSAAWDDYLILLGGPFLALVSARGIVAAKVTGQTIQKTVTDDGSASLLQALQDDGGRPSLVDNQYLIFNLVAFVYVIVGVASTDRLPTIPALLLALTSSSAAGYVLNKAVDANPPAISSLTPAAARLGSRVVIQGQNLMPGGSGPPAVTIGGLNALVDEDATTTKITVTVPAGLTAQAQEVLVTTGAHVTAAGRSLDILADKPQVLGVAPISPQPGQKLTIQTLGVILDGVTPAPVSVLFDDVPVATHATRLGSIDVITVDAPARPPNGKKSTSMVVRTSRLTDSDPITLTFSPDDPPQPQASPADQSSPDGGHDG